MNADFHGQMVDTMFSFIEPIIEISKDDTYFVLQAETCFDFREKNDFDQTAIVPKEAKMIEGEKIEVPIDIMMSLLRPDELEKLKNYAMAYSKKYMSGEG